jgi:transposase
MASPAEVAAMRGRVDQQESILSLMTPSRRVPKGHPIRRIKEIADRELERLSTVFDEMYDERGRYSIPPETLLKSLLLIALYSVRSERQFCERVQYDLLFRFFLDMASRRRRLTTRPSPRTAIG